MLGDLQQQEISLAPGKPGRKAWRTARYGLRSMDQQETEKTIAGKPWKVT
jgi:hypothetical protein